MGGIGGLVTDISNPLTVFRAMTTPDWAFVALACGIVFCFLGPRMLRDIRGWIS